MRIRSFFFIASFWLLPGCATTREISMFGGGYPQPVRGELSGSMSAGFGEIYIDMPEGERLTGRVTFFTEGNNRKCRASLVGPSGARLECTADIDRGTGHGVGSCTDERERKFTWHF